MREGGGKENGESERARVRARVTRQYMHINFKACMICTCIKCTCIKYTCSYEYTCTRIQIHMNISCRFMSIMH